MALGYGGFKVGTVAEANAHIKALEKAIGNFSTQLSYEELKARRVLANQLPNGEYPLFEQQRWLNFAVDAVVKILPGTVSPPVPAGNALQMGVTVFSAWADPRPDCNAVPGVMCPAERPWQALQTTDRKMALGEYDERDPAITAQRIRWWEDNGVDFVTYQIEWAHEHTQPDKMPPWRPKLSSPMTMDHCAFNHSASSTKVKFALSHWDSSAGDALWTEMVGNGWTANDVRESWRQFATRAAGFMLKPNYLHIEGKPVLMRGHPQKLAFYKDRFGIEPQEIIQIWRDEVRRLTGKELYLIATSAEPAFRPRLKAIGFDALTEYLLHGKGWDDAMASYRYWWDEDLRQCRADGLDYWVPASGGYDSAAWGSIEGAEVKHIPTPAQFTAHLKAARALALANPDVCKPFILSYAWNEIGEGGIIEPMMPGQLHDGDSMLRAHRAATL